MDMLVSNRKAGSQRHTHDVRAQTSGLGCLIDALEVNA